MARPAPFYRQDFSGGENLKSNPEFLLENQVAQALNCVIAPSGHLQTRDGKTAVTSASLGAKPILSLHRYTQEDGDQWLLAQYDTSLYAVAWDGDDTISSWGTAIKTGLTANSKLRSVVWKNNIYFTNGTENPFSFDGTTVADISGSPPKSYIIKIYAGRMWLVDAANPNQIRFSDLENPAVWNALNVIKVRDADGDRITGLAPVSGGMAIMKRNSVYPLYGTNIDNIRLGEAISRYVGNQGYDTYIDDGVFLGKDNIYRFSLSEVTPISDTHATLIQSQPDYIKQAAVMVAHPIESRALLKLGDGDDTVMCIEGRYNGAITRWRGQNIGCFCVCDDKTDGGSLLFGDADAGLVYKYTGTTDNGTAIVTDIKTGYEMHGSSREKEWRYFEPELELFASGGYLVNIVVDVDRDRVSSSQAAAGSVGLTQSLIWETGKWDENYWQTERRIVKKKFWLHTMRGDRCAFNVISGNPFRFMGYWTRYREVGNL